VLWAVKETPSGVKYVDVAKGEGASPKEGDFVIINYIGYLSDGRIFDGIHAKGKKPLAFKMGAKQVRVPAPRHPPVRLRHRALGLPVRLTS
jgi:FKBP-type peptidyl-prolyl cis-trans isomerase